MQALTWARARAVALATDINYAIHINRHVTSDCQVKARGARGVSQYATGVNMQLTYRLRSVQGDCATVKDFHIFNPKLAVGIEGDCTIGRDCQVRAIELTVAIDCN